MSNLEALFILFSCDIFSFFIVGERLKNHEKDR
jgi:hypothetical protein